MPLATGERSEGRPEDPLLVRGCCLPPVPSKPYEFIGFGDWVLEGSLAGFVWAGFWGLGGSWGL